MKPVPKKELIREIGWFAALSAGVALLLGLAVVKLTASRQATQSLQGDIESKLAQLRGRLLSPEERGTLLATEALLADWQDAGTSQAERISLISLAAAVTGVTLLSLRDEDDGLSEDGRVCSHSHSLRGEGNYRQIAAFLDELTAAPGMLAIEELEITRDAEDQGNSLQASLRTTWFTASRSEIGGSVAQTEAPGESSR